MGHSGRARLHVPRAGLHAQGAGAQAQGTESQVQGAEGRGAGLQAHRAGVQAHGAWMHGRELSGLGNRGGFIGVGVGQGLLNERMQFGHNSRGLGCKLVEKQRPQGLLQGHGGLILSPFCLEQSSI
jgi:hypothetical protein